MSLKNRIVKRTATILIVLILLLIIAFIIENVRRDSVSNYPPVGDFIDYDHSKIHYFKIGSGDRTVVFSSGNGTTSPYIDMYHMQEEISNRTETIVYERPGYGWSEPTSRERSISTIVDEIEVVLDEASDNQSFIFVGHSMAALEIIHYAQKYPEKVDGIVLIDGVHPQYASQMENLVPVSIHITKLINSTGVMRLLSHVDSVKQNLIQARDLPENLNDLALDFSLNQMWNQTMLAERRELNKNGQIVVNGNHLEDIPLIIFSASENPMEGWKQSQETFTSWSNHAEQIWVDTNNHFIHLEQPELIIKEIHQLLDRE